MSCFSSQLQCYNTKTCWLSPKDRNCRRWSLKVQCLTAGHVPRHPPGLENPPPGDQQFSLTHRQHFVKPASLFQHLCSDCPAVIQHHGKCFVLCSHWQNCQNWGYLTAIRLIIWLLSAVLTDTVVPRRCAQGGKWRGLLTADTKKWKQTVDGALTPI